MRIVCGVKWNFKWSFGATSVTSVWLETTIDNGGKIDAKSKSLSVKLILLKEYGLNWFLSNSLGGKMKFVHLVIVWTMFLT